MTNINKSRGKLLEETREVNRNKRENFGRKKKK